MRERSLGVQVIDSVTQNAILHLLEQHRNRLPLPCQKLGVDPMKCLNFHSDAATVRGQSAAKCLGLLTVGDNHPDRSQGIGFLQGSHLLYDIGSFALSGWC